MTSLGALARDSGTFLMVAMDQRESLRTMLAEHHPPPIEDAQLVAFKLAAARELAPHASGFLIDRHYGFDDVVLPDSCGLLLAADALVQAPGEPVEDTELDPGLDIEAAVARGVSALKLLVIWRRPGERLELARRFVELCRAHGFLSVLEGVVRVDGDREAAIVEAARELSSVGPSLYKVEVPLRDIERRCAEIDAAVGCPWVVLSSGVDPEYFPRAVEIACRAGASGMLAGRAIWRSAVSAVDPAAAMRADAVPRLQQLGEIVDRYGRPWNERT
jgi:sulfofructosephosphate aldolase